MRHFIWILAALLVGCSSYVNLGNGKAMRTVVTEEPSLFGTNAGFMRLEQCEATQREGYHYESLELTNCQPNSHWVPIQSQGQGGQIVSGAMIGLGFGLGSAFSGAAGSSSSSSSAASSSSSVVRGKGH